MRGLWTDLYARRAAALALALVGLGLLAASPASAKTFSPKPGTEELVEDVNKANADGEANTIVLEGNKFKSYLPPKKLVYTNTKGALTIEGPAGSPNVVDGPAKLNGASIEAQPTETLLVGTGATVTLKHLMFLDGGLEQPPAIEDLGTLNVESSTVADSLTPAVFVNPGATLNVTNSTISNGAESGVVNQGTASFFNSTVAFNKLGGIENSGTLNLTNTIVAENTKGGGEDCEGLPATTSDHSLDSDGTCGVGSLSSKNPLLVAELVDIGGTTELHPLKAGSPAIGAGDSATCTASDQRGASRAKPCSIGADEFSSTVPTIKVPANITKEAEGSEGAIVEYEATATGVNDAVTSLACTPASGSTFPIGKTTVTCSAVDGHENKATATFTVEVTPKSAPTGPPTISVPPDITTPATSSSGAVVSYTATATPASGTTVTSFKCTPATGSTFAITTSTVTCTAVASNSQEATATFKVTVTDTAPTISGVPSDITTPATSASGAVVTFTNPTATDFADGTDTVTCAPSSGSTFAITTTAVTCSATNKAGLKSSATFKVTVTDTAPTITGVPADISKEATGASGAVVTFTTPTATDFADGTDTVTCAPASGSTFAITTTTVTCSATNKAGLKSSATFKVTVTPQSTPEGPPTLVVPADISTPATSASGAVVSYTATATPASGTTITSFACTPASGSTFAITTTTVSCTAVASNTKEATATFKVTVTDTAPTITGVPADITKEATGPTGAVVTFTTPTATDFADGTDTVTCAPASGSTFAITTTTVTCSATNKAGLKSSATFKVTVTPQSTPEGPPTLVVPADISTPATSASGAVVSYTATATPASGTTITSFACTPASGSTFAITTTTVSCTAVASNSKEATATFKVTVTDTAPTITGVPADITTPATSASGAVVTFTTPTATDFADGTDTVTCAPSSGSTFAITTTTVTCSATNKAGLKSSATFKVTVTPQSTPEGPPTIAVPSDISTPATSTSGAVVSYTATATPASGTTITSFACTPASGSTFAITTTTVSCTAVASNTKEATATFKVTVTDTAPTITGLPANITKAATGSTGAVVTFTNPTATDFADGTDTVTCAPASGSTFAITTTTVTCSATNKAGLKSSATFKVTVTPLVVAAPPTITVPADITTAATSSSGAVVMYKATATPAPGTTISSFNCTPLSGVVFPITTTTVNCVAIASNGLQATATFKVTVTPQQEVKVPPATLIRELLQAVSSSKIPRGIRLELTGLLQIALHNLQTPPHRGRSLGGYGQAPPLPFAQLFAPLDGLHLGAARRGCSTQSAINDLELFIAVIKHDQKQRRPQIPSALASAGIRSASSIVASLACKSQGNSGGR